MKIFVHCVVAFIAILSAGDALGAERTKPFPQPYGAYKWDNPPYTDEYRRLVTQGVDVLKHGHVEDGLKLLYQAAKLPLSYKGWENDGPPNYELWDDIGVEECKRSENTTGLFLLKDYRCAVEMTVHDVQCYVGWDPAPVANASLTPRCFRAFCGDIWKPKGQTVGPSGDEDVEGIESGKAELKRANALIKACQLPVAARPTR